MVCAGMELVYGGGNVGLMGVIADTVLAEGGAVTGVIPGFLKDLEVAHLGLTTPCRRDHAREESPDGGPRGRVHLSAWRLRDL